MKRLNEELTYDIDHELVDQAELELAWECHYPDHIWNIDHGEKPPLNELVTEAARQRFINEGIFPDELNVLDMNPDDIIPNKFDRSDSNDPPGCIENLYETNPMFMASRQRRMHRYGNIEDMS